MGRSGEVPTYPDEVRAAERAAIRQRRQRGLRSVGLAALRVAELNREFSDRYGGEILPNDDAGRDDVTIMLHHLARRSGYPMQRIDPWLDARAPWLVGHEREALLDRVFANPLRFKADTLAKKIGLTAERRARLRIKTIGAIDQTAAERKEARRIKKRDYLRARRQLLREKHEPANPV
jgi:hypothetical protein